MRGNCQEKVETMVMKKSIILINSLVLTKVNSKRKCNKYLQK